MRQRPAPLPTQQVYSAVHDNPTNASDTVSIEAAYKNRNKDSNNSLEYGHLWLKLKLFIEPVILINISDDDSI